MPSSLGPVLVVDDDAAFARSVADVLEAHGLTVSTAEDGTDALRLAGEREYAAAVVDLVMPGMDGIETADGLRMISPDTQIVILTGRGTKEAAIQGIQHKVYDFLEKATIDLERLQRTVSSAADNAGLRRMRRDLLRRLTDSNQLLTSLNAIAASLSSEAHVDRVLDELVQSARRLFAEARAARVVLFDTAEVGEFVVTSASGDGAGGMVGLRLARGRSLGVAAVQSSRVVVSLNSRADVRFDRRFDDLGSTSDAWLACAPLVHRGVTGVLALEGPAESPLEETHANLLGTLAQQAAVSIDNAVQHERATNYFTHTSELLVSLLDRVDPGAAGHARKVAELSDLISRRMGLDDGQRRAVHFAALLHDIGRIRLPGPLLDTRQPLDDAGWRGVREHPQLGFELLRPIAVWQDVLPIVHAHHERWDGGGYPRGLDGPDIPLGARIVAVADAFDAMTRRLGPGAPRTPNETIAEIEAGAGSQFDPKVVRLFVAAYRHSLEPQRG